MKNALILHGISGSPRENWFPWLKDELERKGWKVWVPDLPQSEKPSIERYNDFIFSSGWKFDEDSVVIGHSAGAVAALGLLEALPPDVTIKEAILVAAFKKDLGGWDPSGLFKKPFDIKTTKMRVEFWRSLRRGAQSLKGLFEKPFDFEKIKSHATKFVFIHSDDDPYCALSGAEYLAKKLGGELVVLPSQKHFSIGTAGEQYKKFPFLVELIEKI